MLVLNRKEGEVIEVDGPCRITIVSLRNDRARVGIDAEKHVQIVRPDAKVKTPKQRAAG